MPKQPTGLIVEPDADTRLLYRLSLRELDAEVDEAGDGAQALARALVNPPQVVITELRMPRIDGQTLCSLLRAEDPTRQAHVIVVTGDVTPDASHVARTHGADAFLAKPCSPDLLASTVRDMLRAGERRAPVDLPSVDGPSESSRPRTMSRACLRGMTVDPPTPAPPLHCPRCDASLQYDHTQMGGVNDRFAERWDYYHCGRCGSFQYRHRTRKLRAVGAAEHIA
jgi:CheY-like chemotaxis protein